MNKNKSQFLTQILSTPRGYKPIFRYILNSDDMTNLISKASSLNKKNLEKLNELSDKVLNKDLI